MLKFVKLLSEVQCANQNFVPASTLVRKRGQTLGSDPFKERDIGDIANALVNACAQLGRTSLPESGC